MKLLFGLILTVVLLTAIIVIKHTLYTSIHRQEREKSEEPS